MHNIGKITSALVCVLLPFTAVSDVYKHVDESGRVIFSDQKTDGAKAVELKEGNIVSGSEPRYVFETIYKDTCPFAPVKSKICRVEVVEKRSDFAMLRVHYHYVKGSEHSNKIVAKANKGTHDNVIGTRGGFDLIEGDNTMDIPMGMYKAGEYTEANPYHSHYIMIEAKGLTEDGKRYTSPHIFRIYAEYKKAWYTQGDKSSWR